MQLELEKSSKLKLNIDFNVLINYFRYALVFSFMGEINWGQRNESKGRKGNERRGGGECLQNGGTKQDLNKKGKFAKARKGKEPRGVRERFNP